MNMPALSTGFALSVGAYVAGAFASLACWRKPVLARRICCSAALAGAGLGGITSVLGILRGTPVAWSVPSGVPLFAYSFSYDALAGFFNLALAIPVAAVSIYSFGYLKAFEGKRNIGLFGFLFHLVLLSLTITFTAANAFLFLIAWEVMALAAYGLVTFYHEDQETRRAGLLYVIMAHIDAGCLLLGFALLINASGSAEFASFRPLAAQLNSGQQTAAFILFFLGFAIKAGVIPFHVWLPAAHPVAPSNVSALLSGIVIKTGIYGMARIFLDVLGGVPPWAGLLVLLVGVVSAVLGVLYALMEHDLKRLLAYHSIENIGIIIMGLGAALMFLHTGHTVLAALALIAGLYHTINHASFKGLLFLGAGAVLHATHTRNMEEMGGLIKRMPQTAFFFLIGAVAISALPPLNGFVSEWLTYQALLQGFGTTDSLMRLIFPLSGAMLALTGALAAACFVKAFGITFLAQPRSKQAEQAREVSGSMRFGMGVLAAACVALGLFPAQFVQLLDPLTQQLTGQQISAQLSLANGLVLASLTEKSGTVSTLGILLMLVCLLPIPFALWLVFARKSKTRRGPTWDCGQRGLTPQMEYTATGFSKPIRMIFKALFRPRRDVQREYEFSPYFATTIRFESHVEEVFERRIYQPLQILILRVSRQIRGLQAGSIHAYLLYIFVTLLLLLMFAT